MIHTHECYRELYTNKDKFIILITGGRGSGKSFSAGTFIERLTFELGQLEDSHKIAHQILFTRYTMVSAEISVIPEFLDKVRADGTEKYFHKTKRDVTNLSTGSTVMFRGIHTSSGNQTAKLKSIHGITTFVVDEAEEWVSEQEFDTIMLSIRQKGLQNRIIIIMNPTDSNHFIYQKYIKDTHKLVDYDGVPVQISTHPNVLHIHTTYLNNMKHVGEQFLKEIADMKEKQPEKYAHIVIGRWADVAEGAVYKKWGIVDEFPVNARNVGKGLDFGFTCLRHDTPVTTKEGIKEISKISIGDMVLTSNGYRRVRAVLPRGKREAIIKAFTLGDKRVVFHATPEHKFKCNGTWRQYNAIGKYDLLYTPKGYVPIRNMEVLGTEITEVYDLSVEGCHEFFANGVLVHNCDPSACVKFGEVYTQEGVDLYLDEQFYQTGMLIADLIRELKAQDGHLFVYADSADPRLIEEISLGGVIIYGVQKYAGSILAGIEKAKDYNHIYVTKRSINLHDELRNYTWDKDRNGNYINVPVDANNHACFVGDTLVTMRNGVKKKITNITVGEKVLTSGGARRVTAFIDQGEREVCDYIITTFHGIHRVTCTPDHKIRMADGSWKEIGRLTEREEIMCYSDNRVCKVSRIKLITEKRRRMEHVYDITVEDKHEYFANSLLVSNCDAFRYGILGKIMGRVIRKEYKDKQRNGNFTLN